MSSTETAEGSSPSTALAVGCWMAATFCADSRAPGRSFTRTLALAGWRFSANSESLAKVT